MAPPPRPAPTPPPRAALLAQDQIGQRLQAAFAGDARARLALGAIGQVEIFDCLQRGRRDNGLRQLGVSLPCSAISRNTSRLRACNARKRLGAVGDRLNLHLIQFAGRLFAIARDEGHGIAIVEQFERAQHLVSRIASSLGERPRQLGGFERLGDGDVGEGQRGDRGR